MAAFDQHVGRNRKPHVRRYRQQRAIVADAQPDRSAGARRTGEVTRDQLEFRHHAPIVQNASSRYDGKCQSARMISPVCNRACADFMNPTDDKKEELKRQLRQAALEYHEFPTPGKIGIAPTKQLVNQRDLSLAYTPGVASACEEIAADPANAFRYTGRGNLVAVITNGTAVLGLGNIGPLAAKPVMEGKAVLFKKFAGIDVFDIEINETDPDKLCDIIAALERTFGGINLEDIKAPECFTVERKLRARMKIPVFHDDQHGTAIIVAAAILNGLKVVGKGIKNCKMVVSGAGAAALA